MALICRRADITCIFFSKRSIITVEKMRKMYRWTAKIIIS